VTAAVVLVLSVVAIVLMIAGATWSSAQKQKSWLQITGRVTSSEVRMSGGSFYPDVRYEYEHQGKRYHGDRVVSCQITYNWRHRSKRAVARYPANATVAVYIDPKYPISSVLEPGGDRHFWPFIVIFCSLILLFGWIWISQL
jgi:preprotein translocase subunit SecY